MGKSELAGARWRRSSRSENNGGQCVEVAELRDRVAVRDSKDPGGPVLTFAPGAWAAFTSGVKTGRL